MAIEVRSCDDWVAIYKDGAKVWENHSCDIVSGLEALGIPFERMSFDTNGYGEPITYDGSEAFPDTLT